MDNNLKELISEVRGIVDNEPDALNFFRRTNAPLFGASICTGVYGSYLLSWQTHHAMVTYRFAELTYWHNIADTYDIDGDLSEDEIADLAGVKVSMHDAFTDYFTAVTSRDDQINKLEASDFFMTLGEVV